MAHPLTEVSTDAVPARDRLHLWGDAVWRLIGGLESDAFGDDAFAGHITSGQAGYVNLCQLDVSRHRVVRTPSLIRGSDRAYIKVVAQLEAHGMVKLGEQREITPAVSRRILEAAL